MPKCERYIGMDYSGAETPTSIGTPLPLWPKWQDQNGAEVADASRLCSACISGGTPLPLLGGACVNFTQPAAAGKAVAETAKRPS